MVDEVRDEARFDRAYLQAAAALLERGPTAFAAALAAAGTADSAGPGPAAVAAPLADVDPALGATLERVLRRPLTAESHATLADTLAARGVLVRSGLERRIAVALDASRHADRYLLALLMARMRGWHEARAELSRVIRESGDPRLAARARGALEQVERARDADEAGERALRR
jgi:hypothetical protein